MDEPPLRSSDPIIQGTTPILTQKKIIKRSGAVTKRLPWFSRIFRHRGVDVSKAGEQQLRYRSGPSVLRLLLDCIESDGMNNEEILHG